MDPANPSQTIIGEDEEMLGSYYDLAGGLLEGWRMLLCTHNTYRPFVVLAVLRKRMRVWY